MKGILICGYNGRMGRCLTAYLNEKVTSAYAAAGFGRRLASAPFPVFTSLDDVDVEIDVAVDFTGAQSCGDVAAWCKGREIPLVACVTGSGEAYEAYLKEISKIIPVFRAANLSRGAWVMKEAAAFIRRRLGSGYDTSLVEIHHKNKKDIPSGTALNLAKALQNSGKVERNPKEEDSKNNPEEIIKINSLRGGGIFGDHEVLFLGENETLCLSHRALGREVFACGAVEAVEFIVEKEKGYYTMEDLFDE